MAFWRVAGFAQPSPIEQILDKEEYTLEELLDEDDIIQECKSLNGRLIAFLREKEVVEQLLRYLVQPPSDPDDPKKQYKYPFTACEVFCCEVEAVFNTLLEDEALLNLLFSLLDADPPLSCKTAGYFGRVVGQLLLRKTNEMMQYLSNNDGLLEKLVRHLDVTSIADVIKRLAGADEQSSMVFLPMHTAWLVETQLLDMLLERLGPGWPSDTVTNAADILTAIAHTQPSALSAKLMQPASIAALFKRALEPGGKVLVPALEVCSALLEPRRGMGPEALSAGGDASPGGSSGGGGAEGGSSGGVGGSPTAAAAAAAKPRMEALGAMLVYLPQLVSFLGSQDADATQETPYGLLAPPLGRARLRVVELLAVLLHVGDEEVDEALIVANAMSLVMDLFKQYPFNNLLHHQVFYMMQGLLQRASPAMVEHTFGTCGFVSWLSSLPAEVTPVQRPGGPEAKGPLRAGYLGHVTRMGNLIVESAAARQAVADALAGDEAWLQFAAGYLQQRNEVEDVTRWECGRPTSTEMGELGSDGDDFQNDMDLEQMQGMQPALYHRYGVLDDIDDDDEEGGDAAAATGLGGSGDYSGAAYGTMLAAAMQNMDISGDGGSGSNGGSGGGAGSSGEGLDGVVLGDVVREREVEGLGGGESGSGQGTGGSWSLLAHPGPATPAAADTSGERSMEDDAVLLTTSDDEDGGPSVSGADSPGPGEPSGADGRFAAPDSSVQLPAEGPGLGVSPPSDDMVIVEPPAPDEDVCASGLTEVVSVVEGPSAAAASTVEAVGPHAGPSGDGVVRADNAVAESGDGAPAAAADGKGSVSDHQAAAAGNSSSGEHGFTDHASWEDKPLVQETSA